MTERGLPIVDGAPACPFVAFEDDREERATSPDSRHRCYAEVRPAPRALAHQDAYCLTNAFGVCPTFQDWARRESARIRGEGRGEARGEDRGRRDDRETAQAPQAGRPGPAASMDEPARRNPQRGWSAPPPWMGSFEEDPFSGRDDTPGWGDEGSRRRQVAGSRGRGDEPGARRPDAGLAGSLAHRIAMDGQPIDGGGSVAPPQRPQRVEPRFDDAVRRPQPPASREEDGGFDDPYGMVGDAADIDELGSQEAGPGARERLGALGASAGAAIARVGGMVPRRPGGGGQAPRVSQVRPRPPSRRDPVAPPWERPVRYEAYPTLRTRMGLPAIPRSVLFFVALVLAAVLLFLLPQFLGVGSPKATPTPLPVPSRSPGPTFSFAPSATPGPTFVTYVVQPGDTMSKIAARFGVPLTMLIDANKDKYPNPDRITAGDSLIIPSALPSAFKDATPTKAP